MHLTAAKNPYLNYATSWQGHLYYIQIVQSETAVSVFSFVILFYILGHLQAGVNTADKFNRKLAV